MWWCACDSHPTTLRRAATSLHFSSLLRSCCTLLCGLRHLGLPRWRASLLVRLQLGHESIDAFRSLRVGNRRIKDRAVLGSHRVVRQPTGEADDESLFERYLHELAVIQIDRRNIGSEPAEHA